MGRRKKIVAKPINDVKETLIKKSVSEKNMKFYVVVYLKDGTIHLWPGDTKEECLKTKDKLLKTKWKPRIKAFRFIKRNLNNCKDGYIL